MKHIWTKNWKRVPRKFKKKCKKSLLGYEWYKRHMFRCEDFKYDNIIYK